MRAERWEQVKAVLHAALDTPPAEREAYLAAACAADDELREEVDSLLDAYDTDDPFMEAPAFAATVPVADALPAGGRVGRYRLVREIGRGGMGAVYLAERDDGEFRQQVALKVVKRGMDTELILRRFRHERQILAGLDHPNVARLLDGGTTEDGVPYFVMELIDGVPIDRYCAARGLGTAERLALFRDVCAAVQFAHQRLVVHRDIKPANVLVTAAGLPKLLDFGIAKLLTNAPDDRTAAPTDDALRAMTPAYASPEQVRGEPVTTLSDVYSLGVMLYELLAGAHPYAIADRTPADLARAVTETEPARPSIIARTERERRALRGDLDTIVLAAMRKDPARRYASVDQLSDDVRRHLAGLPVRAQADTLAYRARTFVRRNRLVVAAAGLLLASLLGGIVATAHEARVARAERARAERRFDDVRTLATSFVFELHDAIRDLSGSTAARALLMQRALASLDALARESRNDASLARDVAAAYLRVGDVQGLPNTPNLGQTDGALASYGKALVILDRLARQVPQDTAARRELSVAYQRRGRLQARVGDDAGAVASQRRAVALGEALLAAAPNDTAYRRLVGEHTLYLGRAVYLRPGIAATREGLALFERSLAMREALLRVAPRDPVLRYGVAQSLESVAYALWRIGERAADTASFRAALQRLRRAHVMRIALLADDTTNGRVRRSVADGDREMGQLEATLGDTRVAAASFRSALAAFEPLAAKDPGNAQAQLDLAQSHAGLAEALAKLGDHAGAVAHARQSLAILESLHAADRTNADVRDLLAAARATVTRLAADARGPAS